jgi:flagellar biosynthesis protein FlhG
LREVFKADQASTLRKVVTQMGTQVKTSRAPRVLSITSGKGGVGKTNIAANLAFIFSQSGKKVFVLDADIGLANIDILLGLTPEYNLQHVFSGEKKIDDVIVEGPGGMKILPASSGVQELSELNQAQKLFLLSEFGSLTGEIDIFIIDTGAGISSNVMYFNMAAQEKCIVVTPEPTSITDAYALMKVMSARYGVNKFTMIANQVKDEKEALGLYTNLSAVIERFLTVSLDYAGHIVSDKHVTQSIRQQKLVTILYPECPASMCFAKLAGKILKYSHASAPTGTIGFFWNSILENAAS